MGWLAAIDSIGKFEEPVGANAAHNRPGQPREQE